MQQQSVRPQQPGGPDRPDRGTASDYALLPLLDRITAETMEPDYEAAAARKRAATSADPGDPGDPAAHDRSGRTGDLGGSGGVLLRLLTVLAVGVVTAVAITQTSHDAADAEDSRVVLVERIETRRERNAAIQRAISEDRRAVDRASARARTLADRTRERGVESVRLGVRTGFVAVRGPGLRITVGDPSGADPDDIVRDEDLALLVNGLWTAGAEAIAINGQRMTALTYIKNSSEVINVNSRPLTAPYTVDAIGDPRTIAADLLEAPTGARFLDYARLFGFSVTQKVERDLRLPGARRRPLRALGPNVPDPSGGVGSGVENRGAAP